MKATNKLLPVLICIFFSLQGCSYKSRHHLDPLEPLNRHIYKVSTTVDNLYIKPFVLLYKKLVPNPIKNSIGNFFDNVHEVPNAINHLLQANPDQTFNALARLGINSTIGFLGLFDVASSFGFEMNKQDFGLTLLKWGYKHSSYLYIPIFGPSTFRDLVAMPVASYMDPGYYLEPKWRNRYYGASYFHKRYELEQLTVVLEAAAVDKYAFIRNAYFQHREHLETGGDENKVNSELLGEPPE